jgi:hypothetical protein
MPRLRGAFFMALRLKKASIISAAYELSKKPQLACEILSSHANCMKMKIGNFVKALFYKGFIESKKLAQRSQLPW